MTPVPPPVHSSPNSGVKTLTPVTDVRYYRPISNSLIASKSLEQFVTRPVVGHLKSNNLLPDRQCANRSGFSTETTVLRVLSDMLEAVDEADVAFLALFDLLAAFGTVDQCDITQEAYISHIVLMALCFINGSNHISIGTSRLQLSAFTMVT